jgi:hypothetical protein
MNQAPLDMNLAPLNMHQAQFDPNAMANVVFSDVYFLWQTASRFKWTHTPGIIVDKLRRDLEVLSERELEDTIERLTSTYGLVAVRDTNSSTVALHLNGLTVRIGRGKK